MLCGLSYYRSTVIIREHFQRRRNRVMMLDAATQTVEEGLFNKMKPLSGCSGFTKALPQPAGESPPKYIQIDVSICEIARWKSQKRKSAAWFEMNSDDTQLFPGRGHEPLPVST